MDRRNIYIIVAVVVVLAVLGYALGWFGGSRTPPAVTAPTPPAAAPAPSPAPAPTPAPASPAPAQ
jgi:flagellar basal body-associated protein FliL